MSRYFETVKMRLKGDVMVMISTVNFYMGMFYVGKKLCGNPNNCLPTVNFRHSEDSGPAASSPILPSSSSAVLPLLC